MPKLGRLDLALCLVAALVTAAVVVVAQRGLPGFGVAAPAPATAPDLRSTTDQQLSSLQSWLREHPEDTRMTAQLGQVYLQKARETGDPAYYPRAEAAFGAVLKSDPRQLSALVGMGSLALSRHQFADGLRWGEQARAVAPDSVAALGVVADAQTELGRYDDAVATIQRMVDLRPDLSSYSRVSYARELHGDLRGAIAAMTQAAEAGGPRQEGTAWVRVQLGNLYFATGDLTRAQTQYQQALDDVPDYLHALAGLAKVEAARGHYQPAIALYQRAIANVPLPEYVIALADVYQAAGQPEQAAEQGRLLQTIRTLYAANGVDVDLELALYDLDHDRNLPGALAEARAQVEKRPSIKTQDVLAWALYKNGDCAGAQQATTQALRLGTRDALMLFHAGLIADCLGRHEQARDYLAQATALNPRFSLLYADRARETLARLGGAPTTAVARSGGAS